MRPRIRCSESEEEPTFMDTIIALEALVSKRLWDLGVDNDLTWDAPGESSHVDLRVYHPSGNRSQDFEIRLTLGTKEPRRLKAFVKDSLNTDNRGVRIYVEISATIKHTLQMIAERVARTVREIIRRFRDFGPDRLIGVRIHTNPNRPPMERIALMRRAHLSPSFSG